MSQSHDPINHAGSPSALVYSPADRTYAKGVALVQTSVPNNEGDSGGPLLDDAGRAVGVVAATAWEAGGGALALFRKRTETPEVAVRHARPMAATGLIRPDGRPPFAGLTHAGAVLERPGDDVIDPASAADEVREFPSPPDLSKMLGASIAACRVVQALRARGR